MSELLVATHELQRRAVHACGAVIPAGWVVGLLSFQQVQALWIGAAVLTGLLESARLGGRLASPIYDRLIREYERDHLAGYALYTVGMATVAVMPALGIGVSPALAVAAMLMLAIGDPISGIAGSGELRPSKQGFVLLIMFGTCTLLAVPLVESELAAIAGGVGATVADGLKPVVLGRVVDDNLTIAPVAAAAMAVASALA